jgi:hypothetical protein
MNIQGRSRPRISTRSGVAQVAPPAHRTLARIAHSVASRDPSLCSYLLNRGGLLNKQGTRKPSIQVAQETAIKEGFKCCVCQFSDQETPLVVSFAHSGSRWQRLQMPKVPYS